MAGAEGGSLSGVMQSRGWRLEEGAGRAESRLCTSAGSVSSAGLTAAPQLMSEDKAVLLGSWSRTWNRVRRVAPVTSGCS